MPFTDKLKEYTIDLRLPPEERWAEVIATETKPARALAREFVSALRKNFPGYGKPRGAVLKKAIMAGYRLSGGRYLEEMEAWAKALRRPLDDVLLMQCSYELSHAPVDVPDFLDRGRSWLPALGCTAGVSHDQGFGMCHVRTMDWELKGIGPATRIFRFEDGRRQFVVVGILGLVGALSGMLTGRYSVTVNFAPPSVLPRFQFGPLFLVREVLETCDTYLEAVRTLREMPVSSNVFFTVCGARKGEACVIERMPNAAVVRRYRGSPLVQANHFNSRRFAGHNKYIMGADDEDTTSLLEDSLARQAALESSLAALPAHMRSLDDGATVLARAPVLNDQTLQRMIFCPRSGAMEVWRR